MKKRDNKICLISSSGGHFEQLKNLNKLNLKHDVFYVTEKTDYSIKSDYYLPQTGLKDFLFPVKIIVILLKSIYIWIKEKPDFVISTGTMVALPMFFIAKIFRKKIIYIETFSRIYDGTKTGKLMYKYADLFIVQWESLLEIYPNAIYGGSLY